MNNILTGIIRGMSDGLHSIDVFGSNRLARLMQHYGYVSRPKDGAHGLLIRRGDQIIIIGSDDSRYTIELRDGETAIHDDSGNKVHLKGKDGIEAKSPYKIVNDAPEVFLGSGPTRQKLATEAFVTQIYDLHMHPAVGGSTGTPTMTSAMLPTALTQATEAS